jgi:hypothetical protein
MPAVGTLGFREFFWVCFKRALHSSTGSAGAVSLVLTVVGGAVQDKLPWIRPGWEYLNWVAPLTVGLVLFIPAVFRVAYELYRDVAARLEPLESRFNAKERLGTVLYHMSIVIRRFETWNADSGRESPVEHTRRLFEGLEQLLIDTVGVHYSARMYRFVARQRTETDLQNSYGNLCEARNELERIISELPD